MSVGVTVAGMRREELRDTVVWPHSHVARAMSG